MSDSRRGYSLVEMLVVVAIIGTIIGALHDVLFQGMQAVARTRVAEMSPQLDTAWLAVRRDLQASVAPPRNGDGWSESPLELALPGGATVRLALRSGALVREEQPSGAGLPARSRVLARPVRAFRWRVPAEGLIEVELAPARAWDAFAARVAPPRASSLLCATRGSGRNGGGW
jgi:prepilin-type N-terminal cleavage/methylation domain-containing protein